MNSANSPEARLIGSAIATMCVCATNWRSWTIDSGAESELYTSIDKYAESLDVQSALLIGSH
jgi:hypothetical protein